MAQRQGSHVDGEFVRVPGLFRRWELDQVVESGRDYRLESAGEASDGTPLFLVYRRDVSNPQKEHRP